MTGAALAAVLAGSAAALCIPATATGVGSRVRLVTAGIAGAAMVAAMAEPAGTLGPWLAPAGVVGAGLVAVWKLRVRQRAQAVAIATAANIQVACEGLASSLAAGVPIGTALEGAADDWPPLSVVTRSTRLGGSVPAGLNELATGVPGAGDLRLVAAAWQVAERSGAGIAVAVDSVAALIRSRQATRRLVRSELASARATARLLAGLPVLTLLLGAGLGGDPVAFLLTTGPGLLCLAGGLMSALAGLWWIETIARAVEEET
jgi:tight adherence protein B